MNRSSSSPAGHTVIAPPPPEVFQRSVAPPVPVYRPMFPDPPKPVRRKRSLGRLALWASVVLLGVGAASAVLAMGDLTPSGESSPAPILAAAPATVLEPDVLPGSGQPARQDDVTPVVAAPRVKVPASQPTRAAAKPAPAPVKPTPAPVKPAPAPTQPAPNAYPSQPSLPPPRTSPPEDPTNPPAPEPRARPRRTPGIGFPLPRFRVPESRTKTPTRRHPRWQRRAEP